MKKCIREHCISSPYVSSKQITKLKSVSVLVRSSVIPIMKSYQVIDMTLITDLTFFCKLKHDSSLCGIWGRITVLGAIDYSQWICLFYSTNGGFLQVTLRESVVINQPPKHNSRNFCLLSCCCCCTVSLLMFGNHTCMKQIGVVNRTAADLRAEAELPVG